MRADDIKQSDARPVAYLIATAYPLLWERFVVRCQYEAQYPELDPRLLEQERVELKIAA